MDNNSPYKRRTCTLYKNIDRMNSLKHTDHCDPELWIRHVISGTDMWLHNKIRDLMVHTSVLWGYTTLLKEYNGITVRPRSYHANPINHHTFLCYTRPSFGVDSHSLHQSSKTHCSQKRQTQLPLQSPWWGRIDLALWARSELVLLPPPLYTLYRACKLKPYKN